jgi:hypothetical protein
MANSKISTMPAAAALTGDELVEGVQDGGTVALTTADIAALAPLPPSNRLIPAGGTAGQALAKVDSADYNVSWQTISGGGGGVGGGLGGMQLIGKVQLASAAADMTVTNIPATFDNLLVIVCARGTTAAQFTDALMRFNGDTGNNYDFEDFHVFQNGTNFSQTTAASAAMIASTIPAATATAGRAASVSVFIPDYARTSFTKQSHSSSGAALGTGTFNIGTGHYAQTWRNTAAITQVAVIPAAGNFEAGSTLYVYGLGPTGVNVPDAPGTIPDLVFWNSGSVLGASGYKVPFLHNSCPWMPQLSASGGSVGVSATQLNGRNVLTFPAGAAGRYTLAASVLLKTITAFAVYKPASNPSSAFLLGGPNNSQLFAVNSGKPTFGKNGVAFTGAATTALTVGSWAQFNGTYDDATGAYAFRLNRAADGSGTSAQTITVASSTIGYNPLGTDDLAGDLAELIIYNRVLTAPEIAAVEAYLNTKWGV